MVLFDVLIFSAAFIIIYLYWNTPSELPIQETSARPKKSEGFTDKSVTATHTISNISMCPGMSKSFVAKNGDNHCCEGNPAGTDCEGITICTLSSTDKNNQKYPSCVKYLQDYYARKGLTVCPRSLPNYFEDDSGRRFCTNSRLNSSMNGPYSSSAEKCTVGGKGYMDTNSCEVRVALDRMPCPSPGCTKQPLNTRNESVILMAHFNDLSGIKHTCYDKESLFRLWENIYGPDWKAKTSHINPDRNILFCDVAKKYYIDKTLSKNQIDV
jgi:hypothetical protein